MYFCFEFQTVLQLLLFVRSELLQLDLFQTRWRWYEKHFFRMILVVFMAMWISMLGPCVLRACDFGGTHLLHPWRQNILTLFSNMEEVCSSGTLAPNYRPYGVTAHKSSFCNILPLAHTDSESCLLCWGSDINCSFLELQFPRKYSCKKVK